MYTKPMVNAKRILIETESCETFTLRIRGRDTVRLFCDRCQAVEEMLDLNAAADISGTAARDLVRHLQQGQLHSPENANGHLLVCRASLEDAINNDDMVRSVEFRLEENL